MYGSAAERDFRSFFDRMNTRNRSTRGCVNCFVLWSLVVFTPLPLCCCPLSFSMSVVVVTAIVDRLVESIQPLVALIGACLSFLAYQPILLTIKI